MSESLTPFNRSLVNGDYERSVTYAVHGFWSGDSVGVRQSKDHRDLKWKEPEINWSCGGRTYGQEPDDTIAAQCFAKAIADAVKVARRWRKASAAIAKATKPISNSGEKP